MCGTFSYRFISLDVYGSRLCHKEGHADPPPPQKWRIKKWLWTVRNVLNRTGKLIKKFSDFYFSSYCEKFIENWRFLEQKWRIMTITRKIKIGKIENLIFLFIQPCAVLSLNFTTFGEFFFSILMFKIFFLNQMKFFFLQKWSNLHERSGIGWRERKNKF